MDVMRKIPSHMWHKDLDAIKMARKEYSETGKPIIANVNASGSITLVTKSSDGAFELEGCLSWHDDDQVSLPAGLGLSEIA